MTKMPTRKKFKKYVDEYGDACIFIYKFSISKFVQCLYWLQKNGLLPKTEIGVTADWTWGFCDLPNGYICKPREIKKSVCYKGRKKSVKKREEKVLRRNEGGIS